jgi:2-(1,2-epoxy-1,2-dihydrophenyl)acetyl-CoA isomerase
MNQTSESYSVDQETGVATIRLVRPDEMNALDLRSAEDLESAVRSAGLDPAVRAVVIQSGGRAFCAGGDVRAMAAADDPAAYVVELANVLHRGLRALWALTAPVVSVVHGVAAGGGVGIALSADVVLATPRARFVAAYPKIGISPDCGASYLVTRAAGAARAARFLLLDEPLSAAAAQEAGLLSEIVPEQELDDRVEQIGRTLADPANSAYSATKALLRRGTRAAHSEALDAELESVRNLVATPYALGQLARFLAS